MSNSKETKRPNGKNGGGMLSFAPRWMLVSAAVILLAGLALAATLLRGGNHAELATSEYLVQKADLKINVLEGGNLISDKPDKFTCEVEGRTTIVDIVPDGYIVTPEDVANKKVLVQLDASSLSDRVITLEINVQGAEASYKQAQVNYAIQQKQNESDIDEATLKVTFARMDFDKYLGADLAKTVLENEQGKAAVIAAVAKLAENPNTKEDLPMGGASLQTWRQLCSDIDLADQSLAQAKVKYEWSLRLGPTDFKDPETGKPGMGYISRTDVKDDELGYNRADRDLKQKKLALEMFVQYDFPKQLAQLGSDFTEAGRELERIKARAEGQLARQEANLRGTEAQFKTQARNLDNLRAQLKSTQVVATRPGVVVYASSFDIGSRWRSPIMAGTAVQERQLLIVIPDPQNMAVEVKVHEASVNKIVDALRNATPESPIRARIVLDAFPDKVLWGTVTRVADMPDPQNFMFSPDVKIYNTTVKIADPPSYLKTGMSAKVEIYIASLKDVIAVPVQTVVKMNGKNVCYVTNANGVPAARIVTTGQSNDKFIEIAEGLKAGEKVLLRPPEGEDTTQPTEQDAVASDASLAKLAPPVTLAEPAGNGNGDKASADNGKAREIDPDKFDIDRALARMPEEQRAPAKELWDAATREQRIEMIKKWQAAAGGGRGRRQRPSTTSPAEGAP